MGIPWFKTLAVFGQELVSNPRPMGAACPSSPGLARRIATLVGARKDNFVLEIGAGTGSITAALLRHCVAPEQLIAVERSAPLVGLLRQRFASVRIIEGDACELTATLERLGDIDLRRITHVVSSLPLRSLPPEQVDKISREFQQLLAHGSRLVQYTYNLRHGSTTLFTQLRRRATSVVWLNLPPARVEMFSAASSPLSQYRKRSSPQFSLGAGTKPVNASPRH